MSKKGLGKGLDALFGDNADEAAAHDFEYIPLKHIEPKQDQPRTIFDQDGITDLADSIREHGVLSPLIVRSVEGGRYQIIAGERRWRAARDAGLTEVPVRIVTANDQQTLVLALVENLQREDLNPIEEARVFRALMEDFNMTQEQVAKAVSKSRPSVANSLRLLALPGELIELILREDLPVGSARALLALKDAEDMKAAAQTVVKNEMNVREVESLVRKLSREKSERPNKRELEVNYLLEAQKQLTSAMGRRVTIKQSKGKGKIELEYYDQEDFDSLFDFLSDCVAGGVKNNDD